ncbi:hypothetical protein K227x_34760 [Rubripirellula lacrimiformis]|uniref:Secreted protein n=1 Tax=Rubripirellula lacrimiformis TaxID=1930273 RepID=A0A517NDE6_9BACT|nr:hypothetical protein K227x_34760 [Rubripirellula lacrimiformis]
MKFVTKHFASVVLVISVCSLCNDAQAQSGSRGNGYSAPAMSAPPTPRMSRVPKQSLSAPSVAPVHSQPMAVGFGCASGDCSGSVSASPSVSYWPSMTYPSYTTSQPASTQYRQSHYRSVPATCSNGQCHTRRRMFRHR